MPTLRFPGFTDEWQLVTLGDITVNFSNRNKSQLDYPMYSVTNNRGFIPQNEQFEDREMVGEDIKAYKIIEQGEFAYNPARINVGSIAKYDGSEPCMISSLYVCFRTTKNVDGDWLMQYLKSPKANYYYNANGEGGVRIYLFYPNFARIRTAIPSLSEQHKIVGLLKLIDERIATQNKIIERLESLITGISNQIFNDLKEDVYLPLGKIADIYQPQTIPTSHFTVSGYPVYGANGIIGYYHTFNHEQEQICIACRGNTCGTVNFTDAKCWITGNAMVVNVENTKSQINKRYLYHYLRSLNYTSIISGSGQPQIVRGPLSKLQIPMASINHQIKISMILDKLCEKIDMEKVISRLLSQEKQFYLNSLFI